MTPARMGIAAVFWITTLGVAAELHYPAAAENCVRDGMVVQTAAAGLRAGIEPPDEVGRVMLLERTLTRQPVSNERLEVIKRLVQYAAAHQGDGEGSAQWKGDLDERDLDMSIQFERACESGNW